MLKNIILISNSLPKSGSTLLYHCQRTFFEFISGRNMPTDKILRYYGCNNLGGFIANPNSKEVINFISNDKFIHGPIVIKTHAILSGTLLEAILNRPNIYSSLIVRDPIDIMLSARDNYNKTGEFNRFASLESGCEIINGYYHDIYNSVARHLGRIPIVHYRDLMHDRLKTTWETLPDSIQDHYSLDDLRSVLSSTDVDKKASRRFNKGETTRNKSDLNHDEINYLADKLHEFREKLGYITT